METSHGPKSGAKEPKCWWDIAPFESTGGIRQWQGSTTGDVIQDSRAKRHGDGKRLHLIYYESFAISGSALVPG